MNWIKRLFNKKVKNKCAIHGVSGNSCKCGHNDRVTRYLIRNSHNLELDKENIIKVDGIIYKVRDVGGYYH